MPQENTIRTQVCEKAKAFGIDIDPNIFPDFGRTPAMIQLDPESAPEQVRGDYYVLINRRDEKGWQPITTVSDRYVIVPHEVMLNAFFDQAQPIIDTLGMPTHFDLQLQGHGTRMFTKMQFDQASQMVNGDKVFPMLSLANAVDTSKKLITQVEVKREACDNGMRVIDSRFPNAKASQRHIGDEAGDEMVTQFLLEALEKVPHLATAISQWEGWSDIPIDVISYITALEDIGFSETQIGKIFEQTLRGFSMYGKVTPTMQIEFASKKESNLWVAYNSVTQFITDNTENLATENRRSEKAGIVFERLANR